MSNDVPPRPSITPADRLSLTLCLAIITHAVVVLGITFSPENKIKPRYDTMEITLVQQKSRKPDDAKLLAQANLEGGGEAANDVAPATPLPPPFPNQQADVAASPPPQTVKAEPKPEVEDKTVTEKPPASSDAKKVLAVEADKKQAPVSKKIDKKNEPNRKQDAKPEQKKVETPTPTAAALLNNSFKIAALSAEIKRKLENKAERPRRKFISANTQEYNYAAYMEAWRAKVERVGNLNYPEEARKRKVSGSLILDVALNPDGSVNQIIVRRSSGYKFLDDAAIRIVELASPFAPFPPAIRKETDILHITRTWQFINNRGFR